MMKEKGLTLVPTLAIYKILSENKGVLSDFMVERSALVTRQQKSTFARAMEKGVKIALGTDAGSPCFGSQPSAFKASYAGLWNASRKDYFFCNVNIGRSIGDVRRNWDD